MKQIATRLTILAASLLLLPGLAPASELGTIAANLKPNQWGELVTKDFNVNGKNILDRCVHSMLAFNNAILWDSAVGQALIIGSGHGEWATGDCVGFVQYDEATNAWTTLPKPPIYNKIHHAWDHTAFIKEKREIYHKTSITEEMYKYDLKTAVWSKIGDTYDQNMDCRYGALEYFPERNGLFWYRVPMLYDVATGKWNKVDFGTEIDNTQTYDPFAEYHPTQKVVLTGGGQGSQSIFKFDRVGKFKRMKDAPFRIGMNNSLQVADPVTGMYVFYDMAGRKIYNYDIAADNWAVKSESTPLKSDYKDYANMVAGYISSHKVIMFVQWQGLTSKVYLYKPDTAKANILPVNTLKPSGESGFNGFRIIGDPHGGSMRIKSAAFAEDGYTLSAADLKGKVLKQWKVGKGQALDINLADASRNRNMKDLGSNIMVFNLSRNGKVLASRMTFLN